MLTIDPTSICDVCGDQYGTVCLPYLIPCGHTFCRNCLVNINDNNPKGASCPLCRDTFTLEQIHLVRVDPADPLPKFSYEQINHSDDTDSDLSDNRTNSPWNQEPRIREEARQLELRVQQAASVKCTFEEVSTLHGDIQNWLLSEPKYKPISKFLALRLSAALLRAILLNSLAFSEASKTSKIAEDGLRDKIKAFESQQTTLQADIRRQQQQYSEKSHECTQLRQEVERLRRANPGSATTSRLHSSPFPGPASPTSPTTPSSTTSSSVQSPPPSSSSTRYLSSPESTSSSRLPPPRSVTTSPTRMNPYAPTSLSSIASLASGTSGASSRSSSAASSASSSPSTQPVREFFTPQTSRQTSPAPVAAAPTSPPTPIPYATRPHQHHAHHAHASKSGLESLMARTSAQPALPRSMTAPLPPNGATPPPIRNGTRPRPIQTSAANAASRNHAYPKVWLPMIDDTEDANSSSAAENTYTYSSHLARHATLRGPGTPTQTSIRR